MIKKPALMLAVLLVATLSVAGCTSTQNTTTNTATSETTTTHNATLERYITAYEQYVANVPRPNNNGTMNGTVSAWQVTWPNATTVKVQAVAYYSQQNLTVASNRTVIIFPTIDAATAYLNAYNKTDYVPSNVTTERGNLSQTALGHPLIVLKASDKIILGEAPPHSIELEQADNLIIITDSAVASS